MAKNVLGTELKLCSLEPMTGFFRDGCCNTGPSDRGLHVVCSRVTAEFLAFSAARGNDLSTPRPEFRFAGLKPGDSWCLCALRWKEAFDAGHAPGVHLESTHEKALEVLELEDLLTHAKVAVAPGVGYGEQGEGYVRIAMVENEQRLRQAARNVKRYLSSLGINSSAA